MSIEKQKKFYKGSISINNKSVEVYNLDIFESSISFTIDGSKLGLKGTLSFSGDLSNDQITGTVKNYMDNSLSFQADRKQLDKKN